MSNHTPGPIRVTSQGSHIVSSEDGRICAKPEHMINWRWPANAHRIQACWNACEGIDTKDLEAGSVSIIHKLHDAAAKRVLEQRDELLAFAQEWLERQGTDQNYMTEKARAAIAKAECGADATQHQASPKQEAQELPEIGSRWTHRNGAPYTVLMVANADTQSEVRYPVTVVYRGDNGKVWSRAASDWHRSMTASPQPDPFAAQAYADDECGPGTEVTLYTGEQRHALHFFREREALIGESILERLEEWAAAELVALTAQRDELLEAINRLLDIAQVTNIDSATVEKVCRAAIAKAECGAV